MKPLSLFSFGYCGWGTHTERLVKLIDSIEKDRGFSPPIFADTRIRRTGRAPGFQNSRFKELVGSERYRWMKGLGNRSIITGSNRIVIDHPESAESLLDLAILSAQAKRRVIFFCQCRWQKTEGNIECHRWQVGELILAAAKRRKIVAEVVEWPGGEPTNIEFNVKPDVFQRVLNGNFDIPLPHGIDPVSLHGPPWGSIVTFRSSGRLVRRLVGHSHWTNKRWHLQVVGGWDDSSKPSDMSKEAEEKLNTEGWSVRHSL